MNALMKRPRARGQPDARARQKGLGDFCRNIVRNKAALAENIGASGGYLVPQEWFLGVDEHLQEEFVFHARAYRQPMTTKECWIPSFDLTATHATGSSPLYGGLNPIWTTTEGSALTESEPAFAGGKLICRDLLCYAVASNQLVQDGGEVLGAYLEKKFTSALGWAVERACFYGDGATQPAGIVTSSATKQTTRQTGGTVTIQDISTLVGDLIPASFRNAVWACSPSALTKIAQITNYFINDGREDDGAAGTLFTRPVYVTENLPLVGTLGDVVFFDPTMYVLGERHIEVTASPHPNFRANQTVFRLWWRGDGRPLPNGVATLADGDTAACFTVLN